MYFPRKEQGKSGLIFTNSKTFGSGTVLALGILGIMSAFTVSAQACEGLRVGPKGIVVEVVDGDTIVLDNDLKVRLIGMQAPKLPLGRIGYEAWPRAEEAKQALADLALGERVEIRYGGAERDRHGRVLGHMYIGENQVWAQEAIVSVGMARVYSFPDNRFCLEELYLAEARARVERVGIWDGDPYYQVRQADRPGRILGRVDKFELVEGRVLNADRVGQRVYLNFGTYWKEDFTIVIERSGLRMFERAGLDPLLLEDALVRVRGWIDSRDGPRIEVTHPEQIEILATR